MANLFPEGTSFEITDYRKNRNNDVSNFKKTYAYDFEKGDFIRGPDGKVLLVDRLEAYVQWCNKVLITKRYKHLSYTSKYGQEYYMLIGKNLSKSAIELEVSRMTREALKVHPYTKSVSNFKFEWNTNKETLDFQFKITTVLDELFTLNKSLDVNTM